MYENINTKRCLGKNGHNHLIFCVAQRNCAETLLTTVRKAFVHVVYMLEE